jgi:hypothetical protein
MSEENFEIKKTIMERNTKIIVALIGLVGIIVGGIFGLIPKSKDASADTAPSVTNTLSPVDDVYAAKLLSSAQAWPVKAKDDFNSNKLGWREEDGYSGREVEAVLSIEDGVYLWNVKSKKPEGGTIWPRPVEMENVPNFYVAVDVLSMAEPDAAKFGLTFRNQGTDNHYDFTISSSQQYEMYYRPNNDTLISSITNEIVPFEFNRIAVIGIGHQFWFYINDIFVDYREHDGGPLTGNVSFVVKPLNDKDWISVTFDNFELREMGEMP